MIYLDKKDIIVGITGASGAIYGKMLIEKILTLDSQVRKCDLIVSDNAGAVWKFELGADPAMLFPLNDRVETKQSGKGPDASVNLSSDESGSTGGVLLRHFSPDNFFAPMASGSAGYDAMIICPCTMGTMGRIAAGISSDLMTRAADVMLKERRKLILVPRETPLSLIHVNNMKLLTEAGAIICPANPSFYSRPATIGELCMTVIDRVLALTGLKIAGYRWGEDQTGV